jgi:hypothetical protein
MLHVDDLIEPRAKKNLLSRLRRSRGRISSLAKPFQSERITNQSCKESPPAYPLPGKFDYLNQPFPDSKSTAWEFFTDD